MTELLIAFNVSVGILSIGNALRQIPAKGRKLTIGGATAYLLLLALAIGNFYYALVNIEKLFKGQI